MLLGKSMGAKLLVTAFSDVSDGCSQISMSPLVAKEYIVEASSNETMLLIMLAGKGGSSGAAIMGGAIGATAIGGTSSEAIIGANDMATGGASGIC